MKEQAGALGEGWGSLPQPLSTTGTSHQTLYRRGETRRVGTKVRDRGQPGAARTPKQVAGHSDCPGDCPRKSLTSGRSRGIVLVVGERGPVPGTRTSPWTVQSVGPGRPCGQGTNPQPTLEVEGCQVSPREYLVPFGQPSGQPPRTLRAGMTSTLRWHGRCQARPGLLP